MDNDYAEFSLLLASSIHDMKNSIGMLLHSVEELYRDADAEAIDEKGKLGILHYEASRINNDLLQLLGVYRMIENRLPMHLDEHYVGDMLEEQIAKNHVLAESRGVQVELSCDDDICWHFDQNLISGVINNVLVNALRYTDNKIALTAEAVDGRLRVSIADNGRGYPASMLENPAGNIQAIDFETGSTSLGIYFADQILKRHGKGDNCGYIAIANGGRLGGGEFSFYLPA